MSTTAPITPASAAMPDPTYALTPTGNLRRRLIVSRIVQAGALFAAAIAVAALVLMMVVVAVHGIGALSLSFFTSSLPLEGSTGTAGGMGPALLGSAELVLMAIIVAVPIGVLIAIYLHEFAGARVYWVIRTAMDTMNGLPTIIAGVFVFSIFVAGHSFSGWSGALALAIVVIPLIGSSSLEAISQVPRDLYDAAEALGIAHWRTVVGVVLPSAWGGILTATILAVARAAGETAPLLFTSSLYPQTVQINPLHGIATVPMEIYTLVEEGYQGGVQKSWGAAFVLLLFILIANIVARMILRHFQKKRGL